AGFGANLDLFGDVVENANADVVKVEVLLDFGNDVGQHLLGVFAGDGGLGDGVEEAQLLRAPLFFGEQAGVFDGHGELTCSRLHDIQVALLEHKLALGVQRHHNPGRFSAQQDGSSAETLGRFAVPDLHHT